MRTGRTLTLFQCLVPGGGGGGWGVYPQRKQKSKKIPPPPKNWRPPGTDLQGMLGYPTFPGLTCKACWDTPCGQTHTCENITLAKTSFRPVTRQHSSRMRTARLPTRFVVVVTTWCQFWRKVLKWTSLQWWPPDVSSEGGRVSRSHVRRGGSYHASYPLTWITYHFPPPRTDTRGNITFPKLRLRTVMMHCSLQPCLLLVTCGIQFILHVQINLKLSNKINQHLQEHEFSWTDKITSHWNKVQETTQTRGFIYKRINMINLQNITLYALVGLCQNSFRIIVCISLEINEWFVI